MVDAATRRTELAAAGVFSASQARRAARRLALRLARRAAREDTQDTGKGRYPRAIRFCPLEERAGLTRSAAGGVALGGSAIGNTVGGGTMGGATYGGGGLSGGAGPAGAHPGMGEGIAGAGQMTRLPARATSEGVPDEAVRSLIHVSGPSC